MSLMRPLLAAVLSAALALPITTVPARADAEDVAKVLGGLAALYILKESIERNRRAAPVQRAPVYRAPVHRPRHTTPNRRSDVKLIPGQCLRTLETRRGTFTGYGARCMQNRVARPGILPPNCIRQIRTDRGTRNLYGPRCLRREGWSVRTARR